MESLCARRASCVGWKRRAPPRAAYGRSASQEVRHRSGHEWLAYPAQGGRTVAAAVVEIFGDPIRQNELDWIKTIREATDNSDPRLTSRSQAAINTIFGK